MSRPRNVYRGSKMDGSVSGTAQGHDKLGRLLPGHTEWAAKRKRINERVQLLCTEYDANSPSRQILLAIAAQHLDEAERTRNSEKRVRSTNAAARLLKQIPLKRPPAPPS